MYCKHPFKDSCQNMVATIASCNQSSITGKRFIVLETILFSDEGNEYRVIRGYDDDPCLEDLIAIATSIFEKNYAESDSKDRTTRFILDRLVVVDTVQRTYKAGI